MQKKNGESDVSFVCVCVCVRVCVWDAVRYAVLVAGEAVPEHAFRFDEVQHDQVPQEVQAQHLRVGVCHALAVLACLVCKVIPPLSPTYCTFRACSLWPA